MTERIVDFKRENYEVVVGDTTYKFKNIEVSPFGKVNFTKSEDGFGNSINGWDVDDVNVEDIEIGWFEWVKINNETFILDFNNFKELYEMVNTKEVLDYILNKERDELEKLLIVKET